MFAIPFREVSPNMQSKSPLVKPGAVSSHSVTWDLGEETNTHVTVTSFQVVVKSDKLSPEPLFSREFLELIMTLYSVPQNFTPSNSDLLLTSQLCYFYVCKWLWQQMKKKYQERYLSFQTWDSHVFKVLHRECSGVVGEENTSHRTGWHYCWTAGFHRLPANWYCLKFRNKKAGFLRQGMAYITKVFSPQLPHLFWHRSPHHLTLLNELRYHYKNPHFISV